MTAIQTFLNLPPLDNGDKLTRAEFERRYQYLTTNIQGNPPIMKELTEKHQKNKSLYDEDFQEWIAETIAKLQSKDFDALDIEHLIEELTDLGKSEKNALRSNLKVLLTHLLKLKVQFDAPDMMKSSWYDSVNEHRERVLDDLISTPSLKSYLDEAVAEAYPGARKLAIKDSKKAKFGVRISDESKYPISCPFSMEQILDEDFYGI